MHSWNMGYDTDTNYTYEYFPNLNPYLIRFNFLSQGLAFPKIDENFNACELGFGNGLSILIHSAASNVNWYGNDFNPSQVEFAQRLAKQTKINLNISDDAFDEYLKRDDLPMFDYICLHGIWSWISPENQDVIVEFVKNKLKVGGVLYISYNVKSGFSHMEPFHFFINSYLNVLGDPEKNSVQKMPEALDFINKLIQVSPENIKNNDWLMGQYNAFINKLNPQYLAHEHANSYWILQSFSQVATKFEQAKLTYVSQANFVQNFNELYLEGKKNSALKPYLNSPLHQDVRDFLGRSSFRTDLYVKGLVKLSDKVQTRELDETYFICTQNLEKEKSLFIPIMFHRHDIDLKRLEPLINIVKDLQCHSYKEFRQKLCDSSAQALTPQQLLNLVSYAVACNILTIAQPPELIKDNATINQCCRNFNDHFLNGMQSETIMYLPSPVLGGGFMLDDVDKVLLKITSSKKDVSRDILLELLCESLAINTDDQKEKLREHIDTFFTFNLPLYKSLKIIC